jgi:hypothetical protein
MNYDILNIEYKQKKGLLSKGIDGLQKIELV